jgi:hypothetical protein
LQKGKFLLPPNYTGRRACPGVFELTFPDDLPGGHQFVISLEGAGAKVCEFECGVDKVTGAFRNDNLAGFSLPLQARRQVRGLSRHGLGVAATIANKITDDNLACRNPDGAMLVLELGGTSPDLYDQLVVNGTADLRGEVQFSIFDRYAPTAGDVFTLLTANSFANLGSLVAFSLIGGDPGLQFETNFSATGLSITFLEQMAPVPVPAALPMFLFGLLSLGVMVRQKNSQAMA